MQEKINKLIQNPKVQYFKDVRVLGLIVFCIIALLVTYSGLGAVQTNFELQQQIVRLEEQNKIRELENANLKLKNQYFNTDQYLELEARRQFGKAAPGETVLVIPRDVALAKIANLPDPVQEETDKPQPSKPMYQQNFEAWMRFLFRSS